MELLVAITSVRAGNGRKAPGTPLVASAAIADELVAMGAARRADPKEFPLADQEPLSELRLLAIAAAVDDFGADDWTQAGTPKVEVLAKVLGFHPAAAETARFKRPS